MGRTPEGKVKDEVRAFLKEIGAYRFSPVQMGMGQKTLDELACVKGQFVAIECKRPGKHPTKYQLLTMAEIHKAGGIVITAWSGADVERELRNRGLLGGV